MPVPVSSRIPSWAATTALELYDKAPGQGQRPLKETLQGLSPAAMKNLLAVVRAAHVRAEVEIYLRYQVGRQIVPADAGDALQGLVKTAQDASGSGDPLPHLRALLGQVSRLHSASQPPRSK